MRRIACLVAALLLCASMVLPVFATEDVFVPSITYKDGPEIEDAELDDDKVGPCLVVSSIKEAREKTTDIYQEDRDLLLEVFEALTEDTMELPLEDDYVIRELVDVSFVVETCIEDDHRHKEELKEDDTTIIIEFDMDIPRDLDVIVMVYIDEEWVPVEIIDRDDDSITCIFEDICPVVFVVEEAPEEQPPKTGDEMGEHLVIWIVLMIVSFLAIVILLILRRNKR